MSKWHSTSYAANGSRGSYWGFSWREKRYKRNEDWSCERGREHCGSKEGSSQTYRSMSDIPEHEHHDRRDQELERLCRMVRDLELEVRGRRRWRNRDEHAKGSVSVKGSHREASHQSGSHCSRDQSRDYVDRGSVSPKGRRPQNAALGAMSWALHRATQSPFSTKIERAPMQSRFTRPLFISYDGKIDPVQHVSHYIHMMSLHNHNDALMCRVFSSSLEPTALRWFNKLRNDLIHSFAKLIQEFGVRFITCSQVPQPVDALLSMKIGVRETLQSYTSRYWELYNEIGGGNEKIVASTFRLRLLEDSELRELLTRRPPNMRQLIRHVKEYKKLRGWSAAE